MQGGCGHLECMGSEEGICHSAQQIMYTQGIFPADEVPEHAELPMMGLGKSEWVRSTLTQQVIPEPVKKNIAIGLIYVATLFRHGTILVLLLSYVFPLSVMC